MINVLFYGDSNTWGFDPETGQRYPYPLRLTSVCARLLGPGYNCIPCGMNGRTTAFDDPVKGARNGIKGLDYELQTHKPLDLFAVMLGTNDLKYTDAAGSADGMDRLLELVLTANARFRFSSPVFPEPGVDAGPRPVLLISPVRLRAHVGNRAGDLEASAGLAGLYRSLAEKHGVYFMDAAEYAEPSPADGIHLAAEGHRAIGEAVAETVRILARTPRGRADNGKERQT